MTADWRDYCHFKDLQLTGDTVLVSLPGGRAHQVSVSDEADAYRLSSVVVRASIASTIDNLAAYAWERNRATELVGFRIDRKGRLVGESWVPKPGLTASEFYVYVHTVATEADRFEYQLTGADSG